MTGPHPLRNQRPPITGRVLADARQQLNRRRQQHRITLAAAFAAGIAIGRKLPR